MSQGSLLFDVAAAHRHFAADCFNRTWALIEKSPRSADDDGAMVLTALASLWHWTQRDDCTDRNLSVGHWQVSRVYALVGDGEKARHHGEQALRYAAEAPPFYVGYAYEALARAAIVLDDRGAMAEHLVAARRCAAAVTDADERQALENDLNAIG